MVNRGYETLTRAEIERQVREFWPNADDDFIQYVADDVELTIKFEEQDKLYASVRKLRSRVWAYNRQKYLMVNRGARIEDEPDGRK